MKKIIICAGRTRVFLFETSGATLVEYGIALLVVIIVGATTMAGLATAVSNELGETASAF